MDLVPTRFTDDKDSPKPIKCYIDKVITIYNYNALKKSILIHTACASISPGKIVRPCKSIH